MAAVAVERAMNFDDRSHHLHPFFAQKKKHELQPAEAVAKESEEAPSTTDNEGEQKDAPKKRAKRSKKQDINGQRTILQGFGIKSEVIPEPSEVAAPAEVEPQAELEADPNYERRKRRKTAPPELEPTVSNGRYASTRVVPDSDGGLLGLDWRQQLEAEAGQSSVRAEDEPVADSVTRTGETTNTNGGPIPGMEHEEKEATQTTPTKQNEDGKSTRTMRLRGGKLASPTTSKQESPKIPRRGRRAKVTEPAMYIVKLDYGKQSPDPKEFGRRIQSILDGETVHKLPVPVQAEAVKSMPKPAGPPKPTHPFFAGKPKKPEVQDGSAASRDEGSNQHVDLIQASPHKTLTTTPGKLRTQRDAFRMPGSPSAERAAPVERKKLKHAGDHPAWPTRENAHVRGIDQATPKQPSDICSTGLSEKSAKRKLDANAVSESENIFNLLARNLDPGGSSMRKPTKVITTGAGLQEAVAERLSVAILDKNSHPALSSMYRSIETALSAFDKYECETQAWTQKYAPMSAVEVLQAGREAHVLKDWLQRSTISAVQTSSKRSTASSTISCSKIKKKRKRKDEDDFIVESDDELDEQNEPLPLSDTSRSNVAQRSLVRGGDNYEHSTPATAILLSGPHGTGKTAAVYAVAKELGFEIFEINSASRRSGKDVLDKIGDMTENHLVQQVSKALTEDKPISVNGKIEAIKIDHPDVPDPKQKSMASFFKAGPAAKKPTAPSNKLQKSIAKAKDDNKPKSRQKQSLILLEEVDVLFEEDKQFWLTVLTLAEHSKRPIVMTCNDERHVPEAFMFHAILRFVPPPIDLATDYLLLLSAREGHILERSAVQSLYKTKAFDLRGSISELNFWCQMAVGDLTHGFNWMLDRYPPGIDVDAQGRILRTASEHTFVRGINVISWDLSLCSQTNSVAKEALWYQAWDDWKVDATNCARQSHVAASDDAQSAWTSLDASALTSDILSAADICFGFGMRGPNDQPLDHSAPPFREKVIASHVLALSGRQDLLWAEPIIDYTSLDKQLAVACRLKAMNLFQASQGDGTDQAASSAADDIIHAVEAKASSSTHNLSRTDFSLALDALGADLDDPSTSTITITSSSFNREFSIVATDLAPYIRTIAREFQTREEELLRMSNLLSAGGRRRQTRNAFAAMDGGKRGERRARYFETWRKMGVVVGDVLRTGGEGWSASLGGDGVETRTGTGSVGEEAEGSLMGTQESDELR